MRVRTSQSQRAKVRRKAKTVKVQRQGKKRKGESPGSSSQLQPRNHSAHFLSHLFIRLAVRVVDGRNDQILQHLDIVFRDNFGIDLDRLKLLGTVDNDRDHAAA